MPDLLTIDHVSLAFGGIAALSDVSVAVADGRITAIIGPNGAGKTSLVNVVSGFYRPNAGAVTFDGDGYPDGNPYKRVVEAEVASEAMG